MVYELWITAANHVLCLTMKWHKSRGAQSCEGPHTPASCHALHCM